MTGEVRTKEDRERDLYLQEEYGFITEYRKDGIRLVFSPLGKEIWNVARNEIEKIINKGIRFFERENLKIEEIFVGVLYEDSENYKDFVVSFMVSKPIDDIDKEIMLPIKLEKEVKVYFDSIKKKIKIKIKFFSIKLWYIKMGDAEYVCVYR